MTFNTLRINYIDNSILCFHQNGDGSITSREFESILRGLGHTHEESHIGTFVSKVSYMTFDITKNIVYQSTFNDYPYLT